MANLDTDNNYPLGPIVAKNAAGAVVGLDPTPPVWASSDETVVTVVAAADGLTALLTTVAPGTARVTVTADADPSSAVQNVIGTTEDLIVTLGPLSIATTIDVPVGSAIPKSPAPAPTASARRAR